MKTAIIFNSFDFGLSYYVLEGDWTRHDGETINVTENSEELCDAFYDLTGRLKHQKSTRDEFVQAVRAGCPVIECGEAS